MVEKDIMERIVALCEARGWTIYRLAKESGITYSTLCTMLHKANSPSIPTLIKICEGFGISLSEFFDCGNEMALLSQEDKAHLTRWHQLSLENQKSADIFIDYLLANQKQ